MNIINVLHPHVVSAHSKIEYESIDKDFINIFIYRRGLTPRLSRVTDHVFNVPVVPIENCTNYRYNKEIRSECMRFIAESVGSMDLCKYKTVSDGLRAAHDFFEQKGNYIYHILYTSDLRFQLGSCYNYVGERKILELSTKTKDERNIIKNKKTMIALPEPLVTGILAVKESHQTRFGMMLCKENIFAFTVE